MSPSVKGTQRRRITVTSSLHGSSRKKGGVTGGRYSARSQPFVQLQKLERKKSCATNSGSPEVELRFSMSLLLSIYVYSYLEGRGLTSASGDRTSEPVFVDLLRGPGIDSQPGGPVRNPICRSELEFLKSLWGLGTEEE